MPVPPLPGESIRDYAHRHVTALPVRELEALYSRSKVRTALKHGLLRSIAPGMVASSAHAGSFWVRAQAASLWSDAPVTGLAALFLWGLINAPPPVIEVLVPHNRQPRAQPGFRVVRTTTPVEEHSVNGIRAVSVSKAIISGFGSVPASAQPEVVFKAVRNRLTSVARIEAELFASPRVRARPRLCRYLASAKAGALSYLEEVGLNTVFTGDEFMGLVRQHEVVVEGEVFYLDMFEPRTRTCVELDGASFHSSADAWQHAIHQDTMLAAIGIHTIRFSYADITSRPGWCRVKVREVLQTRARLQA